MRLSANGVAGMLLLATAGCVQIAKAPPTEQQIGVPTRDSFAASDTLSQQAQVDGWINQLGDPQVVALVHEALEHNQNVALAAARYDEAAARIQLARAALWPTLSGYADATRAKVTSPDPGTYNNYELGGSISWEIDLWGRIRSGAAAAELDAMAQQANARGVRLSIAAQVAEAWFTAIAAHQQVAINVDLLNVQESTQRITSAKTRAGVDTQLEAELAQANVAKARESLTASRQAYADAVRALEVLLNRYPAAELKTAENLPPAQPSFDAGVPSQLLARRPDIVAADRSVAAAFHRVNQAQAAHLPQVTLTADAGTLLHPENMIWSIGAHLLAPVFEGGALEAGVKITEAQQRQSLSQYVLVAINAFREVENALSNERTLRQRQVDLSEATQRLGRAMDIAQKRYDAGQLPLLDLNQVQVQYFAARGTLLNVQADQLRQRIGLYLALGGEIESPAESMNKETAHEQPQ